MATRCSNLCTSSSSTNTSPAIGALKAVARPAPAPAARSTRKSAQHNRQTRAAKTAIPAPIWTVGPSRPSASPEPIASIPPKNFTGTRPNGAGGISSRRTASTCGMPLPEACGGIAAPSTRQPGSRHRTRRRQSRTPRLRGHGPRRSSHRADDRHARAKAGRSPQHIQSPLLR